MANAAAPVSREPSAERVRRFVAAARGKNLRTGLVWALAAVASPVGAVALLLAWWLPWLWWLLGGVFVVAFALALLRAWSQSRGLHTARLLADLPVARPGPLVDGLATWLEREQRGAEVAAAPMAQWLCDDLGRELAALPIEVQRAAGRRRLGGVRYLIPLFVLVCLCWLVWRFIPPPIPGVLAGAVTLSRGAGAGGGATTPVPGGGRDRDLPRPPPPAPPPERQKPPPPLHPAPPPPLLDLPEQQQFVVPHFIGDGPSRQAMVRAAGIGDDGGGSRPRPRSGGQDRTASPPDVTPPDAEQFQRAVEQALQSRHVPPDERPIVERYFHKLGEKR